jgi:hypothetical protein
LVALTPASPPRRQRLFGSLARSRGAKSSSKKAKRWKPARNSRIEQPALRLPLTSAATSRIRATRGPDAAPGKLADCRGLDAARRGAEAAPDPWANVDDALTLLGLLDEALARAEPAEVRLILLDHVERVELWFRHEQVRHETHCHFARGLI